MIKITSTLLLSLFFAAVSIGTHAATFSIEGLITNTTGAFSTLTPTGTPIGGSFVIDDVAVAGGLAGPGDFLPMAFSDGFQVGGFCFASGLGACGGAGSLVPITSIDGAALTFFGGQPTGGSLSATVFSPTFQTSIPVFFDFSVGTFSADGGALGTVNGTANFVVPVPAAVWLLGSALLSLAGMRRRH